jgi:hypothetical protein
LEGYLKPFDGFGWLTAGGFDGFDKFTAGKLTAGRLRAGKRRNQQKCRSPPLCSSFKRCGIRKNAATDHDVAESFRIPTSSEAGVESFHVSGAS